MGEQSSISWDEQVRAWPERPRSVPHIARTLAFWPALIATFVLPVIPLAALFVLVVLITEGASGKFVDGVLVLLGSSFVLGGLIFLAVRLRSGLYATIQAERDRFAADVAAILEADGTPPPFSLYLRPFFTDGRLTADQGVTLALNLGAADIADIGQKRDLERAAAQALEEHAPLISLGRPETRLGAGRIETHDENWRALFEKLIAHAERVVMVPIGQPATLDEIRAIGSSPDLLEKTVFVAPANRRDSSFNFAPDPTIRSVRGMWNWTRDQLAEVLPAFPAYRGGARLVTFPRPDQAVEHVGNGVASVQQPSGIRKFLVEGRSATADPLLLAIFILSAGMVGQALIPMSLQPEQLTYSGELTPTGASSLIGKSVLQNLLILPLAFLMIYKLVTSDLPRRVLLPVHFSLASVGIVSLIFAVLMDNRDAIDPGVYDVWQDLALLLMAFADFLFKYSVVAILLGRNLEKRMLVVVAAIALLSRAYGEWSVSVWQPGGGSMEPPEYLFYTGVAANLALNSLVICLPILPAIAGRLRLQIAAASIAVSGAALAIFLLLREHWLVPHMLAFLDPEKSFDEIMDCDMQCELDRAYGWAWEHFALSYTSAIMAALPIIAWPFILRLWTGVGRPHNWAHPLAKYPA